MMSESDGPERIHGPLKCLSAVCFQVIVCLPPVAQLSVGAVYQYDCPGQPNIPIYLLVMGVVSLLLVLLTILPCTGGFGNHSTTWCCLISLFFFCWFIAGNVWIYSIYEPNYNKTVSSMATDCNNTLYLFALWTTNLNYILLGFFNVCSCCTCLMRGET